jgi:hypothetical protein
VERSLGDELVAFFGFPVSHEDDALRAVRTVLDVRLKVQSHNAGHSVRPRTQAGIETGDIVITAPGGLLPGIVTGPVISTARRLARGRGQTTCCSAQGRFGSFEGRHREPGHNAGGWLVLELARASRQAVQDDRHVHRRKHPQGCRVTSQPVVQRSWDNDGRCCGTAGVGDALLDGAQDAPEAAEAGELLAAARVMGDALVERSIRVEAGRSGGSSSTAKTRR